MNKVILEYVDRTEDPAFNESMRLEIPVLEDTHCAAMVRSFVCFLRALGYHPDTVSKYINEDSLCDDSGDYFNGTKDEYFYS